MTPTLATPPGPAPASPAPDPDRAKTAGRGGVAVLGAKLFFLVVGFAQQPLLRLAVGLGNFGGLAQAMAVSNVVNNVVISSGTQGVSRAVAGARGHEDQALRVALRVHVPLAVAVAALMVIGTPIFVGFERAQDVALPLYVLAARGAALRHLRPAHRGAQRAQPLHAAGAARRDVRHAAHRGPHRPGLVLRAPRHVGRARRRRWAGSPRR